MKRDWDLIQLILTEAEKNPAGQMPLTIQIDGYDPLIVNAHIAMLNDADIVKAKLVRGTGIVLSAIILEITFKGYDLLDTIRSKSIWEKIKNTAKEKGLELTFEAIKTLGTNALQQLINN
jgi:hypothetical protein